MKNEYSALKKLRKRDNNYTLELKKYYQEIWKDKKSIHKMWIIFYWLSILWYNKQKRI
jgi:hypothetical protein